MFPPHVWAAEVATNPTFRAGSPRLLFQTREPYVIRVAPHSPFDVTSDGQRFVFMKGREAEGLATQQIDVVLSWADGLVPNGAAGERTR